MPKIVSYKDPGTSITINGVEYLKGSAARRSGIVSYWKNGSQSHGVDHITLESPDDHIPNQFDFHFHISGCRYDCSLKGEGVPSVNYHDSFRRKSQSPSVYVCQFAEAIIDQVCSFDEVSGGNGNLDTYADYLSYEHEYSDDDYYSDDEYDYDYEFDMGEYAGRKGKNSLSNKCRKLIKK